MKFPASWNQNSCTALTYEQKHTHHVVFKQFLHFSVGIIMKWDVLKMHFFYLDLINSVRWKSLNWKTVCKLYVLEHKGTNNQV